MLLVFLIQGIDWLKEAFGDGKHYCRFDPEMPEDLPARNGGVEDYFDDCPLTSRGFQMAVDAGAVCFSINSLLFSIVTQLISKTHRLVFLNNI